MGCVSSTLLNHDDDFTQIGGGAAGLGHHIVSLTSTTYGLLSLDPPPSTTTAPPTPPPRFTLASLFPSPSPLPEPTKSCPQTPEVINSWELMAGLDSTTHSIDSFRFSLPPLQPSKPYPIRDYHNKNNNSRNSHFDHNTENSNPNLIRKSTDLFKPPPPSSKLLEQFEKLCPPNGESRAVIYTTTLRGIRKTFEACNAVRAAIEGSGVAVCERDISMDRGFREELRELMKEKESTQLAPPRVFVKGRYVGGVEEVMKIVEEGCLGELLQGLPKLKAAGCVCEGCGGARFLPCFKCNGSCKLVVMDMLVVKEEEEFRGGQNQNQNQKQGGGRSSTTSSSMVVRCSECNENGLVLCPICR